MPEIHRDGVVGSGEDVDVGWDALGAWGEAVVHGPLAGGVRNDVRLVDLDGRRVVARWSGRSEEDLAWETSLLVDLAAAGLDVPEPVPAQDGRRVIDGMVVLPFVEGRRPEHGADWERVAAALRAVHEVGTRLGRAQRPGWAGTAELLTVDAGTSVDLTQMPAEAVARCRTAWARLAGRPRTVIHGDPNPDNVRITPDGRAVLLDWDEARIDAPDLDLADLPGDAGALARDRGFAADQAAHAWEAAVCWCGDRAYAQHRLEQVGAARTVGDLRRDELAVLGWSGSASHLENVAGQLERRRTGAVDYLVVRDLDGAPVCKGGIDYEEFSGAGTINQLATHPDLEGRGHATFLIAAAERRIAARGLRRARLGVEPGNERAVRLYEHLGYERVGERDTGWEYTRDDGVRDFYRTTVVDLEKAVVPS
jgi:ribosomal protein S18 acetylase RimI-like enzyme